MTWQCGAIDSGITIFPDGKIRPCCLTAANYSKPIESIFDNNRFQDLKQEDKPEACRVCWESEEKGYTSARQQYNDGEFNKNKIKFLDFRHTNHCNLKCRYCGPHFSNQIAKELRIEPSLKTVPLEKYLDSLLVDTLTNVYYTGGEPLISKDHFFILEKLVQKGLSEKVTLRYNTNLSVIEYKKQSFFPLWKNFKKINLDVSLDTAGYQNNFIRSGSDWNQIEKNIKTVLSKNLNNVVLRLTPVISILNIWFLPDLFMFANYNGIKVKPYLLEGPDYLSISSLPQEFRLLARQKIDQIQDYLSASDYKKLCDKLLDDREFLFDHTIQHILMLDKMRNENLFDSLPYAQYAKDKILKNYEYE